MIRKNFSSWRIGARASKRERERERHWRSGNQMACMALGTSTSLLLPSVYLIRPRNSGRPGKVIKGRFEKPLEEVYNVKVERGVSKERLEALGVGRWSMWKTGNCRLPWDWHAEQQVYVVEGEVRVVPDGGSSDRFMSFKAGDLVRYPKWFEADLFFNGPYEERYRFRAYGDD